MKCRYCGNELPDNYKFCTSCGRKVEFPEKKPPVNNGVTRPSTKGTGRSESVSTKGTNSKPLMFVLIGLLGAVAVLLLVIMISNSRSNRADYTGDDGVVIEQQDTNDDNDAYDTEDLQETESPTPEVDSYYLIPDSDTRAIVLADLEGLSWKELCLARNEIFARHGREFKTKEIADYFNSLPWYHGIISPDNFDDNVLSQIEKDNVKFIQAYEDKVYGGSYY